MKYLLIYTQLSTGLITFTPSTPVIMDSKILCQIEAEHHLIYVDNETHGLCIEIPKDRGSN